MPFARWSSRTKAMIFDTSFRESPGMGGMCPKGQ